jgi:hypothetical protein
VTMPTKRDLLGQFNRDELLAILDEHGLTVPDRRKKDAVVEVIAGSRAVKLDGALGSFPRDRLKENRSYGSHLVGQAFEVVPKPDLPLRLVFQNASQEPATIGITAI